MNPAYRRRLTAELPAYSAVATARILVATQALIDRYPLDYADAVLEGHGTQWAKAELRRTHNAEWRSILARVPGTVNDVRQGLTADEVRAWTG